MRKPKQYKQPVGRPTKQPDLKNKGVMISLGVILIARLKLEKNKSRLIQDLLIQYYDL
jgi:hypothetical protein